MFFDELALSDEVLDALWDMHFDECTPVQEKAIPVILGQDGGIYPALADQPGVRRPRSGQTERDYHGADERVGAAD